MPMPLRYFYAVMPFRHVDDAGRRLMLLERCHAAILLLMLTLMR